MRETHNSLLRKRLSVAPQQYLDAIVRGNSALQEVDDDLSGVLTQVLAGMDEGWLEHRTMALAHQSASLVVACAEVLLACDEATTTAITDIQVRLQHLSLGDVSEQQRPIKGRHTRPPRYIAEAYQWLLGNVHNPYPSPDVKRFLASRCALPIREIHDWFGVARRSIGWVDFCKKHFGGSRTLAVEAATRVLLSPTPTQPLSLDIEVDVLSLQGATECLYPEFATNTSFTGESPFLAYPLPDPFPQTDSHCDRRVQEQATSASIEDTHSQTQAQPHARKRRHSNTDGDECRKRIRRDASSEPRKHVVSDPSSPNPGPDDLDALWKDIFDSPLYPPVADISVPVNVVNDVSDPPLSDEQMSELSSFYHTLISGNLHPSTSLSTIPQTLPSPPIIADPQILDTLPVAETTLALEPTSLLTMDESIEQFLLSFASPDNASVPSLDFPDSLSDTSSISTISPPRTPLVSAHSPRQTSSDLDPLAKHPIHSDSSSQSEYYSSADNVFDFLFTETTSVHCPPPEEFDPFATFKITSFDLSSAPSHLAI